MSLSQVYNKTYIMKEERYLQFLPHQDTEKKQNTKRSSLLKQFIVTVDSAWWLKRKSIHCQNHCPVPFNKKNKIIKFKNIMGKINVHLFTRLLNSYELLLYGSKYYTNNFFLLISLFLKFCYRKNVKTRANLETHFTVSKMHRVQQTTLKASSNSNIP